MGYWYYLILLIAVVALLAILMVMLNGSGALGDTKKRRAKDLEGARASAPILGAARRFAALHQYEVIEASRIEANGKSADIDFAVVGCFGVLCVKCVGLCGTIYGGADEDEWARVKNDARETFANPIRECAAVTRVVRDVLFAAKRKNVPVETVCVFTNPKAELVLPRGTGHLTAQEFRSMLGRGKYLYDKGVDEKAVAELLRAAAKKD